MPVLSWRQQLDDLFGWLQKHWLPVTGLVFFASVMLLHGYISRLGLLVGFSALEVLTVMPFVFCLVVFSVGGASFLVSLPLSVLLMPPRAGETPLVGRMLGMPQESPSRLRFGRKMIRGWILVWATSGAMLYLSLFLMNWLKLSEYQRVFLVVFPLTTASLLLSYLYVAILREKKWPVSFDYGMNLLMSVVGQGCVFLVLFSWIFQDSPTDNLSAWRFIWRASVSMLMLVMVAFLQIVLAVALAKYGKQQNLFKIGGGLGLAIVLILSIFPGAGDKLLEHILAGSVSGARACAKIEWYPEAGANFPRLLMQEDGSVSRPVRILAEIGGTLQVRLIHAEHDAVYLVPVSSLVSVMGCEATGLSETANRENP
ncbi:membrane protein [Isoalcanivorax pacificus W11-5]|uniref:Membrane protein n=2 Tax=Isoalcanivorax TaxID=3020833 RepID=A0A0B4XFG0_9GAMM|nr:membrane protein [Isoalcanivorax pacificus W11-5]